VAPKNKVSFFESPFYFKEKKAAGYTTAAFQFELK